MTDRDEILATLERLERKVDGLTDWSGTFTADGLPLTKAQLREMERGTEERDEILRLLGEGELVDRLASGALPQELSDRELEVLAGVRRPGTADDGRPWWRRLIP